MTLFELFALLRKRWKFIILLPLMAGIITAVGAHFLPDEYTASTTMYVLPKNETEDMATSSVTQSDLNFASMLSNDVSTILKSSRVRKDVAEELGLGSLGGYSINVTAGTSSRVLTLTVTGHDPEMTARVANDLADTSEVAVEVMQIQAVNVIDPAEDPGGPSGPRRSRYVAVGIMAGLFAAICLVIIEDMLDTRVRSGEDVEEIVGVPVIGHFTQVERG